MVKILPDKKSLWCKIFKNLIGSCKINIRKAMAHLFEKVFTRSNTIKKSLSIANSGCFQAVAKKLQHGILQYQKNKEKIIL